ncbi:MAG: hypothetical protein SNG10_06955 [Rikenellaceae bacterium]
MRCTLKHISALMLLLFIFTIGGKSVMVMRGCHCIRYITTEEHHHCCDCDEHISDCEYHDQSIDSNCLTHNISFSDVDALSSDLKYSSALKKITLLSYIISLTTPHLECESSGYIEHCEIVTTSHCLEWICDVGLLRAPPAC